MFYIDSAAYQAASALDLYSPSWAWRERHSVRTDLADEVLIQAARLPPSGHQARVVLGFAAKDGELTTETRVDVGSLLMRLAFFAYLALIRIPSGVIRRRWLAAVVRRATAERHRGRDTTQQRTL